MAGEGERVNQGIVLVKGGGDLGTGVVLRLCQQGYRVAVTELPHPLVVRRTVAVASAVYEDRVTVEGVTARRVQDFADITAAWKGGYVPVIVDPEARIARELTPLVVVDAIMAKRNTGTTIHDAPIVVALGPGFYAGVDCHAVVETQRGPNLGNVHFAGQTAPDSGVPGEVGGEAVWRVVRAPVAGTFIGLKRIGDRVHAGEIVGQVNGHPVMVELTGVMRGLLASGLKVQAGMKLGDVDPRGDLALCYHVSDKAWKVADGASYAILTLRGKLSDAERAVLDVPTKQAKSSGVM
jgi:xanthine dehydrogenase accessory factor